MPLLSNFNKVFEAFEKLFQNYTYQIHVINNREKVFLIEDSLILYIGFLTYEENWFGNIKDEINASAEYNCLRIEELVHNDLGFKFDQNKFMKYCNEELKVSVFVTYLKFFRCDRLTINYNEGEVFGDRYVGKVATQPRMPDRVDKIIPSLLIKGRNDNWQGVLYYFIVIEVLDYNDNVGVGIFTTTSKPYSYIVNKGCNWIKKGFHYGNMDALGNFESAFDSYKGKGLKRKEILENKLTYFAVEKYIKDKEELRNAAREVGGNLRNHLYDNIQRNTYIKPSHKWKTEELVYKYIKKLYKGHNVIYQYRPYFLRGETGGQMSYDIFITGLNIAIEYQGKQHFEPVDFFGGEEGFKKTTMRDELKRKLSVQNGIKLVYINYWEDITLDLLKEKINS